MAPLRQSSLEWSARCRRASTGTVTGSAVSTCEFLTPATPSRQVKGGGIPTPQDDRHGANPDHALTDHGGGVSGFEAKALSLIADYAWER